MLLDHFDLCKHLCSEELKLYSKVKLRYIGNIAKTSNIFMKPKFNVKLFNHDCFKNQIKPHLSVPSNAVKYERSLS